MGQPSEMATVWGSAAQTVYQMMIAPKQQHQRGVGPAMGINFDGDPFVCPVCFLTSMLSYVNANVWEGEGGGTCAFSLFNKLGGGRACPKRSSHVDQKSGLLNRGNHLDGVTRKRNTSICRGRPTGVTHKSPTIRRYQMACLCSVGQIFPQIWK